MIATNTAYDNLIAGGASYEWRVVNGSNTWTKDNLISGKLASTLFEKISVGNAISSQLDLSLRNITVDANSPVVLQFRATQNDGASVSSWYTKGTFYIDTVESSPYSEITKITAFDALIKSEIAYMAEGTWTARTALLIMNGIAADIGVAVESSTASYISSNTITLTASPNIGTDGTTKREMLAYIAAMYGGNFRINASNRLELVRANITPTNTAQVGDAVRDFDASAPETISKVRVWADGQTYYPAPGLPLITHKDEPILTEKGETFLVIAEKYLDEWERLEGQALDVNLDMYASLAMAERIYRLFDGITYQPFDCPFSFTNPKYEVGDGIKIKDITSTIGNMELDITPLAPSRVAFGRTETLNNKYTYQPSFQRNTTYQLGLLPDKIASAVENQTTLITGGFGGYIKYTYLEDGTPSELLIMDSDKETTAGSIIRLNRNGIGFSTDGGRTYKNAWTIDGHLVADFIDTGTLNAALVKVINLDASNITTGTIDAGTVNVANINASNITTGTLSADRIAANSIAVGKLTGTITNGGWGINLTNGTMSIGTLAVGSITGNISNGNWKIDFDNGTLSIGNISASNITTGTLNVNDITISGTIKDVPGRNSWNLSTGEFTTTLGKIGGFTIGETELTSVVVQSLFNVVSSLSPTSIQFTSEYDDDNYYTADLTAGGLRLSGTIDGDTKYVWLNTSRRYVSMADISQGTLTEFDILLNSFYGGIRLINNDQTNITTIQLTGRILINGGLELSGTTPYKSTTRTFTYGGVSGTTTIYRQLHTVSFSLSFGGATFSSAATGYDSLFTLPVGYRPIKTEFITGVARTNGGWASASYYPIQLLIGPSGAVELVGDPTQIHSCSYISVSATFATSDDMPF